MSFWVPPRTVREELLDTGDLPLEEVERSLGDMRFVNRWAGDHAAVRRQILPAILARGGGTLLDLGSGLAGVPLYLRELARASGVNLSIFSLDCKLAHLLAARRTWGGSAPQLLAADARSFPFSGKSFDWVLSTLFLHHLSPEENSAMLLEVARIARRGFFILDLRRHRIPQLAVSLLGPLWFRTRVSVVDGRASVDRAYTREEVREIAARARLTNFSVQNVRPFRVLLSAFV